MADIEVQRDGRVTIVTLNRPEHLNAFTLPMIDRWVEILREAGDDPECRVIVLTGAGRGFCSGVELGHLEQEQSTPLASKDMLWRHIHHIPLTLEALDKPVIAAINGVAVGAGLDMALMCDVRLAARSARLSEGYVRVGLVPGDGGAYYLPRLVGPARALELFWTGDFLSAEEAERIGMVNRVVPDEELMDRTLDLARRIAAQPPLVVQTTKRLVYQSLRLDLRTSLDLVSSHMGVLSSTEDSREARRAFLEKRSAEYHGR
jgi:enoyl-CoA hydratase/carnithine racemase